jgi:hypothetical protein
MGEDALIDAHIIVDPRITVSEGHIVFLVYVNPFMVSLSNHEHPSTSSGRTVAT